MRTPESGGACANLQFGGLSVRPEIQADKPSMENKSNQCKKQCVECKLWQRVKGTDNEVLARPCLQKPASPVVPAEGEESARDRRLADEKRQEQVNVSGARA